MIEIFEIFWSAPIELRTLILGCITMGVIQFYKDVKEKNKNQTQKYES